MSVIRATDLRKSYGDVHALDGMSLNVESGQIVGLIGPNGSGKTTAINAILGLTDLNGGDLVVMDKNPRRQRASLMEDVAFIADTGVLPRWMKVCDLIDYVERVHPRFRRDIADGHLAKTEIRKTGLIRALSKGMNVQLHLALVLAMDAPLLVLDEPTLGLDIIFRQQFYDAVLNDYFNEGRSILVTTHEVREIEHILTNVVFVNRGRTALTLNMEEVAEEYTKLTAAGEVELPSQPLATKRSLNGTEYIFKGMPRDQLAALGEVSTPNLAELFVAVVEAA